MKLRWNRGRNAFFTVFLTVVSRVFLTAGSNGKMRNAIASFSAVAFLSTVVFLVAVPQEAVCQDPLSIAKGAMTVLGPFVKSYLSVLRAQREAEKIKIRVWMHNGDTQLNGCGFFFMAHGYAGGSATGYFPNNVKHECGKLRYEMRMTSQSALYDKEIRLGNEQAKKLEVHADGWHNTFVNVMCIGMNERTIAGGPRAFCINNQFLKGCKRLMNKWNDVNTDWDDIMMTRTTRGTHKIIFRDIEILIGGFERLDRNPDDTDAIWTVCDRIDLIKGTDGEDRWECPAKRTWVQATGAGNFYSWSDRYERENKNPYGCNRYTGT